MTSEDPINSKFNIRAVYQQMIRKFHDCHVIVSHVIVIRHAMSYEVSLRFIPQLTGFSNPIG